MTSKFASTIFTLAASLLLAPPSDALAQDSKKKDGQKEPVGKVKITKKDCRRLMVRHRARADVAYKPDTSIRGRKILPADLGGSF